MLWGKGARKEPLSRQDAPYQGDDSERAFLALPGARPDTKLFRMHNSEMKKEATSQMMRPKWTQAGEKAAKSPAAQVRVAT